jgi:hypothetical protein
VHKIEQHQHDLDGCHEDQDANLQAHRQGGQVRDCRLQQSENDQDYQHKAKIRGRARDFRLFIHV